jgi:hypothetical protein
LEFLARVPGICELVAADFNEDWGVRKTNSAIEGASYAGLFPKITFEPVNLLDVNKTAELIARIQPTIIYNATTLQSWWVVNELPPEINARLYRNRCGLGPWTAMHLALTSRLMEAVKISRVKSYVLNSSYPDVVNPSLGRVGLAPTAGIGNADLIVPYVQKAVSELLNVPMRSVGVQLIAHHYHCYTWCRYGRGVEAPFFLRVFVDYEDVTSELGDIAAFVAELPKRGRRPDGRHGQFVVAASAVKNIIAVFNDTEEYTIVPGPLGLEGGYPVRLGRGGPVLALPKGVTLKEARSLNLEAQQYDGILEIRDDGGIVLTDEAYETFRSELGVDCKVITIANAYEQAMELRAKFEDFVHRNTQ